MPHTVYFKQWQLTINRQLKLHPLLFWTVLPFLLFLCHFHCYCHHSCWAATTFIMAARVLTCWHHLNLWPNCAAFLNLGTKCILVLCGGEDQIYYLVPLPPPPLEKNPWYALNRRLGVPRAGPNSLEQRKISCSCRKSNKNSSVF